MGDPLSIAASIAGLISLADLVVTKGGAYVKQVREREETVARLLGEVACLSGVLNGVKIVLDSSQKAQSTTVTDCGPCIIQCKITLEAIKSILSRCTAPQKLPTQSPISIHGARDLLTKLRWPLQHKETTDLLKEVESYKITFTVALSSGNMTLMLQMLTQQSMLDDRVLSINDELQGFRQELRIKQLDEARKETYDWCPGLDQTEKHRSTIQLRENGTGEWFLQTDQIAHWLKQPGSFLWVNGIPGAGKTVLASIVIEKARTAHDSKTAVCYFYCVYDQKKEQSTACILGTLVKQLALQSDIAFGYLLDLHTQITGKDRSSDNLEKCLEKCLQRMLTCFDTTTMIIDALDEAEMSNEGILDFLAFLPKLVVASKTQRSTHVKVLAVSRDTEIIRRAFSGQPSLVVAATSTDIEIYVRQEIERRCQAKVWRSRLTFKDIGLKEIIIESLVNQAAGMFQLAKCQLDHLCRCSGDADMLKAMKKIPPTLQASYHRILKDVLTDGDEIERLLFKKTLKWLIFAKESLDTTQLIEAISLQPGIKSMPHDFVITEEILLSWCSSLVRVDPSTKILSLSHFSVKEYLTSTQISESDVSMFRIAENESNLLLANTCLTYLLSDSMEEALLSFEEAIGADALRYRHDYGLVYKNPRYTLYGYCSKYWHMHIIGEPDASSFQGGLILEFLEKEVVWVKTMSYYNPTNNRYASETWNSLHLATFFGWVSISTALVDRYGLDVNKSYGMPCILVTLPALHWSVYGSDCKQKFSQPTIM